MLACLHKHCSGWQEGAHGSRHNNPLLHVCAPCTGPWCFGLTTPRWDGK